MNFLSTTNNNQSYDLFNNEKFTKNFLDEKRNLNLNNCEEKEFLELFFFLKIQKRNKKTLSEHTIKAYRYDAKTLFEFLNSYNFNLKEIGFPEVQTYNEYINKHFSTRSAIRKLDFLKRLLVFGYQTHFYQTDISKWIEKPTAIKGHYNSQENFSEFSNKRPKLRELDQKEAQQIISFFSKIVKNKKYKDFLITRNNLIGHLLYSTGMRASEIINLNFSSFRKTRNGQIYVDIIGKGNKPRTLPILEKTHKIFEMYKQTVIKDYNLSEIDLEDYPLFFSPYNKNQKKRMTYDNLYKIVKTAVQEAEKNKNISPHWFRHSFVTMMLENNVPLAVVKDLAGHSDISTTNIYLDKINEDKKHEHLSNLDLGL